MPKFILRSFGLVCLMFFGVSMPAPVAATCGIAPPSMTAWFPLDTMMAGTAKNLRSGPAGTAFNGPMLVQGQVADGWEFDGFNDYVQVPDHSSLDFGTGDFSISAWIKTSELWGIIVAKRQPVDDYLGYQFLVAHGQLLLQIADNIDGWKNYHSSSTPTVNDGAWHHVAATVDRDSTSGVRLYIDGQLVHSFNASLREGSISNASDLSIGRANDAPFYPFDGVLDEIQLYNRALTAIEVTGLFASFSDGQCKPTISPLSVSLSCGGDYSGSQQINCTAYASGGVPPYSYAWTYSGNATSSSSIAHQASAYYAWFPYCLPEDWNSFDVQVTDAAGQFVGRWSGPLSCF